MTTRIGLLLVPLALACTITARPQDGYPPDLPGAKVETYKSVNGTDLKVWIFNPEGHRAGDARPAIVFFFGGGWRSGNPRQFAPHCEYVAKRGMVAMTADYRVRNRHGVNATKRVADAKSAIRWVRHNAKRLGVDPNRIAAGGGSAGGHLAAATATLPGHDDPADDRSVTPRPNALALFNPATIVAPIPGKQVRTVEHIAEIMGPVDDGPESMSPYHHVKPGMPPAIIFHGKADTVVAYETAELFAEKVKQKGNRVELVGYEGQEHGFFNYRRNREAFHDTVLRMDEFFRSLGYLQDKPTPASEE